MKRVGVVEVGIELVAAVVVVVAWYVGGEGVSFLQGSPEGYEIGVDVVGYAMAEALHLADDGEAAAEGFDIDGTVVGIAVDDGDEVFGEFGFAAEIFH